MSDSRLSNFTRELLPVEVPPKKIARAAAQFTNWTHTSRPASRHRRETSFAAAQRGRTESGEIAQTPWSHGDPRPRCTSRFRNAMSPCRLRRRISVALSKLQPQATNRQCWKNLGPALPWPARLAPQMQGNRPGMMPVACDGRVHTSPRRSIADSRRQPQPQRTCAGSPHRYSPMVRFSFDWKAALAGAVVGVVSVVTVSLATAGSLAPLVVPGSAPVAAFQPRASSSPPAARPPLICATRCRFGNRHLRGRHGRRPGLANLDGAPSRLGCAAGTARLGRKKLEFFSRSCTERRRYSH